MFELSLQQKPEYSYSIREPYIQDLKKPKPNLTQKNYTHSISSVNTYNSSKISNNKKCSNLLSVLSSQCFLHPNNRNISSNFNIYDNSNFRLGYSNSNKKKQNSFKNFKTSHSNYLNNKPRKDSSRNSMINEKKNFISSIKLNMVSALLNNKKNNQRQLKTESNVNNTSNCFNSSENYSGINSIYTNANFNNKFQLKHVQTKFISSNNNKENNYDSNINSSSLVLSNNRKKKQNNLLRKKLSQIRFNSHNNSNKLYNFNNSKNSKTNIYSKNKNKNKTRNLKQGILLENNVNSNKDNNHFYIPFDSNNTIGYNNTNYNHSNITKNDKKIQLETDIYTPSTKQLFSRRDNSSFNYSKNNVLTRYNSNKYFNNILLHETYSKNNSMTKKHTKCTKQVINNNSFNTSRIIKNNSKNKKKTKNNLVIKNSTSCHALSNITSVPNLLIPQNLNNDSSVKLMKPSAKCSKTLRIHNNIRRNPIIFNTQRGNENSGMNETFNDLQNRVTNLFDQLSYYCLEAIRKKYNNEFY